MTTAQAAGAVSGGAAEWYAIDWPTIHRNVRRLQVRIAQATKERRWGKVQALQRLLTHSYSGKILAVRRVTENTGKKTPGVDQEIWDTPAKRHRQYMNSGVEAKFQGAEAALRSSCSGYDGSKFRRHGHTTTAGV
jgi:hypothetical protein